MCARMQLFNQINARMINDELNVFRGIFRAPMFLWILLLEAALQVHMLAYMPATAHAHPCLSTCLCIFPWESFRPAWAPCCP